MPPTARANPWASPRTMRTQPDPDFAQTSDEQRAIPFDYTFRFDLEGEPDRVVRSIVTVSVEATFIAVSIGYGVVPKLTPVIFGPGSDEVGGSEDPPTLRKISIGSLLNALGSALANSDDTLRGETGPEAALKGGIKLNPQFAELALSNGGQANLTDDVLRSLFQVVSAPADEIQFLYALFDEGSGREFQSEPLLNIAGLGISNGDRPFRYFARPITFDPLSRIRMEVTEKSDFEGELHVSLHGYKVLGSPGSPTGRTGGGWPRRR
jgi:hypothetical protein